MSDQPTADSLRLREIAPRITEFLEPETVDIVAARFPDPDTTEIRRKLER